MTLLRHLDLKRPQGIGTEPTQVAVDPYGCYLTSADSGEDAVALFALRSPCHIVKHQGPGGRTAITVDLMQLVPPSADRARADRLSYPVMAQPEPHLKKLRPGSRPRASAWVPT